MASSNSKDFPDHDGFTNPTFDPTDDAASAPQLREKHHPDTETSTGHYPNTGTSRNSCNIQNAYNSGTVLDNISQIPQPSANYNSSTNLVSSSDTKSSNNGCCCCSVAICRTIAIVLALICVITGIVMLAGVYQLMFDAILKTQMVVSNGSTSYTIWKDTPVPMIISFYLFNLTNPVEFANGTKAELDELGPYTFQEFHEKVGIKFNDNATVSFFQRRWWVFDEEASGKWKLDDPLCFLNTIPVSAAYSVRHSNVAKTGLNMAFNMLNEEITLTRTVLDVLFDGYDDPLLNMTAMIPKNITDILDLPSGILDYDKMGWFYKRNMSDYFDGYFNMFTGDDTLDNLGVLDWWNQTRSPDFFTKPCGNIVGSAGELWPPNQQRTNITFYNTDLCMSMTLKYKEDMEDQYGISGVRYWADNTTFGYPADDVPEHQCFCFENMTDNCPRAGLLDAQTCRMGSPAFISFPHFLHADPTLLTDVNGVSDPVEEDHMFNIDMIPELGVPIHVRARIQINMAVLPYPGDTLLHIGKIDLMAKLPTVTLPLLWFEVDAGLTQEMADEIKPVVFLIRSPTITIIWSLMIALGSLVLVIIAIKSYMAKK